MASLLPLVTASPAPAGWFPSTLSPASGRLADSPLEAMDGYVLCVDFSPNNKTLAVGYRGVGFVLWDVAARKRLGEGPLAVKPGGVDCLAFCPDGKMIAASFIGGVRM